MPLPTDPLLSNQWYLRNTTAGQLDLNLFAVWSPTEGPAYSGAGVINVVIGDGFDYTHPDIAPNYDTSLDFDFVGANSLDAFGNPTDIRGTALLGILGGAANNGGMVGVAFGSQMIGYRVEAPGTDVWLTSLAEAITFSSTNAFADVTLMGQSFMGQTSTMFGAGYTLAKLNAVDTAIDTAVTNGRGGLGTILVRGAGDGRVGGYDVNADSWGNDTQQIIVAAVTETGTVTSYSSHGAPILVSAFGSNGSILTSDRVGSSGLAPGDFTTTFQGTDAAAAMVAGVVDLMLEANPGLSWRDVQTILANSARHTGSDIGTAHSGFERTNWGWNNAATWNGGGLHFSSDYGYGLVDARAAVRMAESWFSAGATATTAQISSTMFMAGAIIPDGNLTGTTFNGTVGTGFAVERVKLTMTFSTTWLSDVEIYITSPDGTTTVLIDDIGGSADFNGTWVFESQAFRGERADGQWSVRVVDDGSGDPTTVSSLSLTAIGLNSTNDRYVFTNEYSDYDGVAGHRTAITDTNGGTDTVDASAVTSNSLIRLNGFNGSIDFVTVSFSNVEHAIGGDGNDTLFGNDAANILVGNRGIDSLSGGLGNDSLYGGTGDDVLEGGGGDNLLTGGAGNDTYIVSSVGDVLVEAVNGGIDTVRTSLASFSIAGLANIENLTALGSANATLTGNSANNALTGNAGNDLLSGGAGDDTLNGGAGNDTMLGGAGNDTYVVDTTGDSVFETTTQISALDAGGVDTVKSSISFNLDSSAGVRFVERLTLTGTAAINGTGNALANVLTGNAGNNRLNGGLGNDTMLGGAGNDTYVVNSTGDRVFETTTTTSTTNAGGIDTVQSAISFNLDSSAGVRFVERLTLTGTAAINGTGNALANLLIGNAGNNLLNGGLGDDTMLGGAGNDTYVVNSTGDRVFETTTTTSTTNAGGIDTVQSAISFNLDSSAGVRFVERLTLTGTAAINGTGNALANVLTGNAANNKLFGGLGNDVLKGAAGNDKLNGGAGKDQLVGGLGNDTLIGGAGKDKLSGGAGRDVFDFNRHTESKTTATTADVIADFTQGKDKIDLSTIDAFAASATNDAFVFRGTAAFSSTTEGEVRFQRVDLAGTANDHTMVFIDTDGDRGVEMAIRLTGLYTLTAGDFIL